MGARGGMWMGTWMGVMGDTCGGESMRDERRRWRVAWMEG